MVNEIIINFFKDLKWDLVITTFFAVILELILILKRHKKNRTLVTKKDIFNWEDLIFSICTSATIYGGISAIYYSWTGKLLFNQNFIISESYIVLFAGLILIALGIITYKNVLKKIKGREK